MCTIWHRFVDVDEICWSRPKYGVFQSYHINNVIHCYCYSILIFQKVRFNDSSWPNYTPNCRFNACKVSWWIICFYLFTYPFKIYLVIRDLFTIEINGLFRTHSRVAVMFSTDLAIHCYLTLFYCYVNIYIGYYTVGLKHNFFFLFFWISKHFYYRLLIS